MMNEEKASPKTLTSLLLLENFISSFWGAEPPQIINKSPEPLGKVRRLFTAPLCSLKGSLKLSEHHTMLSDFQLILVFNV